MERFITDIIYTNKHVSKSPMLELDQQRFYSKLSVLISGEEYLMIEEELNRIYSETERELFYRGFIEGIRFLVGCMN